MTDKNPYSKPQPIRAELNHEQTILSSCSLRTMSPSIGTVMGYFARIFGFGACK